jgi:hypothetical protein
MCPSLPDDSENVAQADCPTNDGRIYETSDGSKWMLACGDDSQSDDGDLGDSLVAETLSECIDLCTDEGIECVGVAFFIESGTCSMKSTMMPNPESGTLVDSAVRIGRSNSAPPSIQLLANGDFTTDVSHWVASSGVDLDWKHGVA